MKRKGNCFLDIARDMVHYEKSILLEFFSVADCEGNLSVSIGKMLLKILGCCFVYVVVRCLLYKEWTLQAIRDGLWGLISILLLELLVGIPIFLVGRKHQEVRKNRNKIMFITFMGLFVLCVLLIVLSRVFGW